MLWFVSRKFTGSFLQYFDWVISGFKLCLLKWMCHVMWQVYVLFFITWHLILLNVDCINQFFSLAVYWCTLLDNTMLAESWDCLFWCTYYCDENLFLIVWKLFKIDLITSDNSLKDLTFALGFIMANLAVAIRLSSHIWSTLLYHAVSW